MAFFRCGMGSGKKYDDYKGKTVTAKAVSSDRANTYLTIPKEGIYDETSKICTPNINLGGIYCLGNASSYNIKTLFPNNYASLTTANFIVVPNNGSAFNDTQMCDLRNITSTLSFSSSYNASTGIFTCSASINHAIMSSSGTNYTSCGIGTTAYVSLNPIKTI